MSEIDRIQKKIDASTIEQENIKKDLHIDLLKISVDTLEWKVNHYKERMEKYKNEYEELLDRLLKR